MCTPLIFLNPTLVDFFAFCWPPEPIMVSGRCEHKNIHHSYVRNFHRIEAHDSYRNSIDAYPVTYSSSCFSRFFKFFTDMIHWFLLNRGYNPNKILTNNSSGKEQQSSNEQNRHNHRSPSDWRVLINHFMNNQP